MGIGLRDVMVVATSDAVLVAVGLEAPGVDGLPHCAGALLMEYVQQVSRKFNDQESSSMTADGDVVDSGVGPEMLTTACRNGWDSVPRTALDLLTLVAEFA